MSIHRATKFDPRGLIAESYHIDSLSLEDARTIFMDWVMVDVGENYDLALQDLMERFGRGYPDHPMSKLIQEGLARKPEQLTKRRAGRASRRQSH